MRGITGGLNLSQQQPAEAALFGTIYDENGNPLPGVSVRINGLVTSTDSSGSYNFRELEPGKYKVAFFKEGYWIEVKSKTLVSGPNFLSFAMTPISEMAPQKKHMILGLTVAGLGIIVIAGLAKGIRFTS